MHVYEVHTHEKHAHEVHAYEMHIHEVYPDEMPAHEMPAHETHAYEVHTLEMHARKVWGEISRPPTLQTVVRWLICRDLSYKIRWRRCPPDPPQSRGLLRWRQRDQCTHSWIAYSGHA
jgi:hypothetical protein